VNLTCLGRGQEVVNSDADGYCVTLGRRKNQRILATTRRLQRGEDCGGVEEVGLRPKTELRSNTASIPPSAADPSCPTPLMVA